eukprot:TRINITY_DN4266_c0_g1_i1.p1 TRINITY_DN4266_c0_g1~~TRINITY_DN4266_c0_g1_i1.p1  ORF type:complete len:362 (+),score=72.48 TRINITY_DN4266_c0_g1_i1:1563-2648(+)
MLLLLCISAQDLTRTCCCLRAHSNSSECNDIMFAEIPCDSEDVISGFDPHSWTQHKVYIAMSILYTGSAIALILYFFLCVMKHNLKNKIYLMILYASICILYVAKGFFYLGGKKVIHYWLPLYRFLSFLPPFMESGCFLIYCLGLQEMLIWEQEAEEGTELNKFKRVRLITFILLAVYAVTYICAYALNIFFMQTKGGQLGKNIYFFYRVGVAVLIAILAMWTTNKVRKSLEKYNDLYEEAITRNIIMAGCLVLHCALKITTSALFITGTLIDAKCYDYNHDHSFYYVGYLALYHLFNEYVPCLIIVILMSMQLSTYDRLHKESMTAEDIGEKFDEMEEHARTKEKLRISLANLDNTLKNN